MVFLGGSIDMGSAPDWQADLIAALSEDDVVILNPRRSVWNERSRPSADDPDFREQVEWELAALEAADIIGLYLAPGSQSPISLLEIGLYARSGKLVVHCAEGFWREGNVQITAARYGVELVDSTPELLASIRRRASSHLRGDKSSNE